MRKLISRMHGGQKGFTLIELLVVIAILGVIAAIVALNVAGFFGRGTLQAAKTELHQAQTAIIAAMADAESNVINLGVTTAVVWAGETGRVIVGSGNKTADAASYVYGPFRAEYTVNCDPEHAEYGIGQIYEGDPSIDGGWGETAIQWSTAYMNWERYEA